MNDVLRRLGEIEWHFADQDLRACRELSRRIAEVARRQDLIVYSDLVKGVSFHLPNVNNGRPFEMYPDDWSDLHRQIIGDFLGHISADRHAPPSGWLATVGNAEVSKVRFPLPVR